MHARRSALEEGSRLNRSAATRELRRYLQQRIDAGEKVVQIPAAQENQALRDGATSAEPAAGTEETLEVPVVRVDSSTPVAGDSLAQVAAEIRTCTKCRLHATRTQAVPGVGPDDAGLVFVGEGPGADEDAQGEPFVGRAGQLLTKIIESVDLRREEVFITNIVKCRPPNNRDPERDEVAACEPYLRRQLRLLQPRVICALGRHAASTLLETQESMARLRQGRHQYAGIRVFPTYHPAALLRNSKWKRPVWEDIQNVRREYDAPEQKP
jgi:DNA polymerase